MKPNIFFTLYNSTGESIQIFAEIENCSSRMVVPKAAIYQTQTFYAKGKMKEVKQLVANLRGESLSSGKTETWNGKMLKIPPVSPSILDCSIIRVEYSLMVSTRFHCIWTNQALSCPSCRHHYSARLSVQSPSRDIDLLGNRTLQGTDLDVVECPYNPFSPGFHGFYVIRD